MRDMTSRARICSERTRKPKPPASLLDYDMQRAHALGYGCHYGDYKADHPNTRAEYEALVDGKPTREPGPGRHEKICAVCGGVFYTTQKLLRKYCGPECEYKAKRERDEKYRPGGKETICPTCGEAFHSIRGQIYCSLGCRDQARKKRLKLTGHDIPCERCGTVFRSTHGKKYCSPDCAATAARIKDLARRKAKKEENTNGTD